MKKNGKKKISRKDHYSAILLEDLKSDFRAVTEVVESLQEGQARLVERMDDFEGHFDMLGARLGSMGSSCDRRLVDLDKKFDMKFVDFDKKLIDLKRWVGDQMLANKQDLRKDLSKAIALEMAKNIQPLHERLDRCEKDIQALKKAS